MPEEPGWRGFALDELQPRWNAPAASLVMGAIWVVWSLPLFFFEGQASRLGLWDGALLAVHRPNDRAVCRSDVDVQ
jgi:hypothetical protein